MPDGVGETDGAGSAVGDSVGDGESVADGESLGEGEGLVADVAVHPLVTSIMPAIAQTAASCPRKALPVMPYTTRPALQACRVPPAAETVLSYAKSQ
jgi:hypothetical protein